MKRRVRALPPGYLVGTKGHSVLKKKTYLAAKRSSIDVEEVYIPKMPISRKIYYEYAYPQSVFHDASAYSNAVVDDSYEIQHQSRGRDHRLLSQMNDALVSTQTHRSPKAAVAALRAGRSKAEAYDYGGYEAYRPLPIKISRHPKTIEALLVGEDKLSDPDRRRKPRKRYYAGKPHRDLQENLSILGIPDTSYLKASKPFDPTPSYGWKAIRDVEGYTKPKNVMSWQYRLDSHLEPEDLTYKPATYGKMRDQVRDVQDKMDRHRQLLDRYADRATLDTGYGEEIAAAGRARIARSIL